MLKLDSAIEWPEFFSRYARLQLKRHDFDDPGTLCFRRRRTAEEHADDGKEQECLCHPSACS